MENEIYLSHKDLKILREELIIQQNNICPICLKELKDPVLDHEHRKKLGGSGKIRKVLCRSCNIYLGKIENNSKRFGFSLIFLPDILRNIANYLESDHLDIIHPSEKPSKPKLKKSSYNKLFKQVNGKYVMPKYNGNFTKRLEKLFEKYEIEPEFY